MMGKRDNNPFNTELFNAVRNNDIEGVRQSINYGATSMHDCMVYACSKNNLPIVSELFEFFTGDVNDLLFIACHNGYERLAEFFIAKGATNYYTACIWAMVGNHDELVDRLNALINSGSL